MWTIDIVREYFEKHNITYNMPQLRKAVFDVIDYHRNHPELTIEEIIKLFWENPSPS